MFFNPLYLKTTWQALSYLPRFQLSKQNPLPHANEKPGRCLCLHLNFKLLSVPLIVDERAHAEFQAAGEHACFQNCSLIIILKWTIKSNNLENHSTRIGGQAVWSKWEIIEYRKKVPIQNHKAIHRYLRGNFQSHFICCPSIFSKWSLQETEVLSKAFIWTRCHFESP